MKYEDIKQGQPFSAYIEKVKVEGHIFKEEGRIYLCQDKKMGDPSPNLLGYRHSWVVFPRNLSYSRNGQRVTRLKLLEGPCRIPYKFGGKVAEWNFSIIGDSVIFGCGAVTLSKNEIATFNKINRILEERSIKLTKEDLKVLNSIK